MSAASAARAQFARPARVTARTAPTGSPSAPRPSLRLVPRRRTQAPRAPFIAVLVLLLGGGLLGLLTLNTMLAQDAFTLHSLQQQSDELAAREQVLQREVAAREVPAALAARATSLGMVPNEFALFIDLKTGRVLGNTDGEKATIPVVPTPAKPAASTPTTATTATTKKPATTTSTTKKPAPTTSTTKTTTKPATKPATTGAGR
jgi:hypothetical protein